MKINKQWLEEHSACSDGVAWFIEKGEEDVKAVVNLLLKEGRFGWANWLVSHALDRKGRIRYAIFAAEQVIKIYEREYPKDDRPRKAIEAAKAVLQKDTEKTRTFAATAAYAASCAASAASCAAFAAYAASYAASAASCASSSYADAAANADVGMKERIIRHGLSLIQEEVESEKESA